MEENPKLKPEQDDPEQSCRFVEMAKMLGANQDQHSFEAAISEIAAAPPCSSPQNTANQNSESKK